MCSYADENLLRWYIMIYVAYLEVTFTVFVMQFFLLGRKQKISYTNFQRGHLKGISVSFSFCLLVGNNYVVLAEVTSKNVEKNEVT